jgi:hypothetical protein
MAPRIAILAQDLIWSDRLARAVEAAGAVAARSKTAPSSTPPSNAPSSRSST